MPIVQTNQLVKTFSEMAVPVEAVAGIDLVIEPSEMVAIVGPSGSGKSTLLNLVGGIDTPSSGQIYLEGTDLATFDDEQATQLRRRRIGFVFQAFNLLPTLNAIENVALPLELDGISSHKALERAQQALDLIGLGHRAEHMPDALSGGEQQRVAIARALVTEPALVIADEPTGNLDSVSSLQVAKLFRSLVDEHRQTVLIATHDMRLAEFADRVVYLRDGQIERIRQGRLRNGEESDHELDDATNLGSSCAS
ncbi:MAG: ABC transporter ATP-binding protein [Planctomycetales bacterium]|nr:ABC transporter ATP-binding protein [Planctomycetales bacterium]